MGLCSTYRASWPNVYSCSEQFNNRLTADLLHRPSWHLIHTPRRAGRPESMCTVHNHFIPLTITSLFDDKSEPAALALRHRLTKTYNRLNNDYKIRFCSLLTAMSNWYENKLIFATITNFDSLTILLWQVLWFPSVKKKDRNINCCLKNMWLIRKLIPFGYKRTKFEVLWSTKTAEWEIVERTSRHNLRVITTDFSTCKITKIIPTFTFFTVNIVVFFFTLC